MRRPERTVAVQPKAAEKKAGSGSRRDLMAVLLALVTFMCLGSIFFLSKGTQFLMPGPMASAHGAIENCGACHTKSGNGKLSWFHGLVAGDPLADSKACITCHKMPETAFNAHSTSAEVLKRSTERLTKVAALTSEPASARVQNIAFPADNVMARGVYCATCHQEHQGAHFDLNKISNEQCRSCHVVKFDSFEGNHPKFEKYPFKRRTRIIYDHAGHFGKHFVEVAQKDSTKQIPETCSSCHNNRDDKRVMSVVAFDQNCSNCHLDQITGKERVSGPKGVAFLSLPGLDVDTLNKRKAEIGEWPEASEAPLTPFLKVMIGRNDRGRAMLRTLEGVNLQDLSNASKKQINAASDLVWEIKRIFYALIAGKASDVLADFNMGSGGKLSASLVADLTASIPRDVVINAHQEWLPNLATEMANRPPETTDQEQSGGGWSASVTEQKLSASVSPEELAGSTSHRTAPNPVPPAPGNEAANFAKTIRLAQANEQTLTKSAPGSVADTLRVDPYGNISKDTTQPAEAAQPQSAQPDTAAATPSGGKATSAAASEPAPSRSGDQTDDLLNLTEEEQRSLGKPVTAGAQPDGGAGESSTASLAPGASPEAAPAAPAEPSAAAPAAGPARAAPVIAIQSDVDPESWAEYGGWYQQDYAIYYRPTGHKDKLIYTWLFLTGPQAPKGGKTPAAAVFDYLTNKDAQGSCTKCHSVDDIQGKGRLVNFAPSRVEMKQGRFTNFIHEPHLGMLENRGCMACHTLEKGRPYLKSYEQGDHKTFVSNFGDVKKDLCQSCHTAGMARQDCLTCHKYHVDGVVTPMMTTKIPGQ